MKHRYLGIEPDVETRLLRVVDRRGKAAAAVGGRPPTITAVLREALAAGLPSVESAAEQLSTVSGVAL